MTETPAIIAQQLRLIEHIAHALDALKRSSERADFISAGWPAIWRARLDLMARELPTGSGFDTTPVIDFDKSDARRIVFRGNYHKMNDVGTYVGWQAFSVTVTPSFIGTMDMRIVGGDADFKDYVADTYRHALVTTFPREAWMD